MLVCTAKSSLLSERSADQLWLLSYMWGVSANRVIRPKVFFVRSVCLICLLVSSCSQVPRYTLRGVLDGFNTERGLGTVQYSTGHVLQFVIQYTTVVMPWLGSD